MKQHALDLTLKALADPARRSTIDLRHQKPVALASWRKLCRSVHRA